MSGAEAAAAHEPGTAAVRFLGRDRPYWRLMIRGSGLLLVTLGLYRFWLSTDMRRFLWSNTELGGETLEYTGTAIELLLGFLIAIAILVPVYAGFFVAALDLGIVGRLSGIVAVVFLWVLGHFAVYRARRYRLTRTVYRGVRFHQSGSAWRYALCAVLWWVAIVVSAGLAYPWAQARLERFKLSHTHYGDLDGSFEGSGLRLFLRGFPLWLIVVAPFVFGLIAAARAVDWRGLAAAAAQGGDDVLGRVEGASPGVGDAVVIVMLACGWAVLAAALLYPAFQAVVLRWWLAGLRFGAVSARSSLRTAQIYGAYIRFLWYGLLFALAGGAIAVVFLIAFGAVIGATGSSVASEAAGTGFVIAGYVVAALAFSAIYQVTVKLALWRLGAQSLTLSGAAALDQVKAAGTPSSALGEGLADALNFGGL